MAHRFLRLMVLLTIGAIALCLVIPVYASHTPPPPPWTSAYYMNTINQTAMYDLGCEWGTKDRNTDGTQYRLMILAYGMPKYQNGAYGASAFNGFVSTSQIAAAVQELGRGYYVCTGYDTSSQLQIAVGTSNYGSSVTYGHGQAWANMVNSINDWFKSRGYSSQVYAVGASDMELGWNSPSVTKNWVNGYDSVNLHPLYNFGDAAGCPSTETSGNAYCSNGWYQADVYYISWAAPPAVPTPQIYRNDGIQARQWWSISLYGYKYGSGSMRFRASLTQYQACQQNGCDPSIDNTPEQGWKQLWDALNHDSRTTSTVTYATDIRWYP
ncbi:hypothetical protein Tmar_1538 [Thermaerobacter marianensis DSM 12885]|uniref:Uncharacterized protein n=1 Tax=Thermaerobacter marianensis (strain ATCC 700841 / DSM 12885 / JCM 10246 / 7p75a) TaxID=644966 RepID=E6SGR4_THEM7|nr:hypothetical protein Tmar_1538 [Thermaerobacter marianensis DSM 12885]